MTAPPLGARHHDVRRLRALLRDPTARLEEGLCVLEGPRVVAGALDRGVHLESAYLGPGAPRAFAPLVARLRGQGVPIVELKEGVLEKVGQVRAPQPVLAVAPRVVTTLDALERDGLVFVALGISDPGNLGSILRSAESAGCAGIVCCGGGVDPFNPKVVRASAGAIFGLALVEGHDASGTLACLRAGGRRCLGAGAHGGAPYHAVDLTGPVAIVLGNEVRGISPEIETSLDGTVTIPLAGKAESLNVAMAATVLAFESARQRQLAAAGRQDGP